MHYADIIAALKKAGQPPVRIARHMDVTPSMVSQVIRGKSTSRRVAEHISSVIGLPISTLWPGLYEAGPEAGAEERARTAVHEKFSHNWQPILRQNKPESVV